MLSCGLECLRSLKISILDRFLCCVSRSSCWVYSSILQRISLDSSDFSFVAILVFKFIIAMHLFPFMSSEFALDLSLLIGSVWV